MKRVWTILLSVLMALNVCTSAFAAELPDGDTPDHGIGDSGVPQQRATPRTGFDPTDIADLLVWYDLSDTATLSLGASGIQKIANKADPGTLDAAQADQSAQPTYVSAGSLGGKPALRLRDGQFLQLGDNSGFYLADMTIVAVMHVDALNATSGDKSNQILSRKSASGGDHNWYFHVTQEHLSIPSLNFGWKVQGGNWPSVGTGGLAVTPGNDYLMVARKDGDSGSIFLGADSASFTGGATPASPNAPVYLGVPSGNQDNEVSINADIGEVLIFDRGLTDGELAQVQDYLTDKFDMPSVTGGGSTFDPTSLAGLKSWYDATALGETDGAALATWENRANPGTHDATQAAGGNRPTYIAASNINGKPAVRLSKSTFLEVASSYNLNNMTIFAVMNASSLDGGGDENQIFSKLATSDPWNHNWYFNINQTRFNFGWKNASGGFNDYTGDNAKLQPDTSYILTGRNNGGSGALFLNGTAVGTLNGSTPATNSAPIYIGGTGAGKSITGDIGEILVYEAGLTDQQIADVHDYLSDKWGVSLDDVPLSKGTIKIDSYELRMFSPETMNYKHVLAPGTATIPVVTADFTAQGATATVTQATSLPGTAKIQVVKGGITKEYTIQLSVLDKELMDLEMPTVEQVTLLDGFWKDQLDQYRTKTVNDVLDKLVSVGTIENFRRAASGSGSPDGRTDPWNDGLLFETIRGASDFLRVQPDAALEAKIDDMIAVIATAQQQNGFLSTWAQLNMPGKYFDETGMHRWYHDSYNFGCLTEAAVHYYKATGKTQLLEVATQFAQFLVNNYGYGEKDGAPKINMVPSHEGPEEMLLKLYTLYRDDAAAKISVETGLAITIDETAYADLVKFWIENRGNNDNRVGSAQYGLSHGPYAQDHARFFDQEMGVGHAVRANLFYTGIAAAGREFDDYTYLSTAVTLWENITAKQMYITGGAGAVGHDEAYGSEYYLPNDGYCETCAQVALGFFSEYLNLTFGEAKYAENVETHMYNGALGAVGLDGASYYYQQPLNDKNRARWNWLEHTPCCPPMFLKYFSELPSYIYAYDAGASNVYVNQFIASEANLDGVQVRQLSGMPWSGDVSVTVDTAATLHIRIPSWTDTARFLVNGSASSYSVENGYAVLSVNAGETVNVAFPLEAKRAYSDPNVTYNVGKVALTYGPMVYTVESVDNAMIPSFSAGDGNVGLPLGAQLTATRDSQKFPAAQFPTIRDGVVVVTFPGEFYSNAGQVETVPVTAVPFFARANRGTSASFVWIDEAVNPRGGEEKPWLAKAQNSRGHGTSAAAAFDGNNSTYWSAGNSNVPQALVVDLGGVKNVGSTSIRFTSGQAWKYQVLHSLDGINWDTFADNSSNSVSQQTFGDTGDVQARYMAFKFTASAGVGYISVEEIQVKEVGGSANIAQNQLCAASSTLDYTDSVFAMLDGDKKNTRYCPPNGNMPQTVWMDLGAVAEIEGMDIVFEKTSNWSYEIQLSDDGNIWTNYDTDTAHITEPDLEHVITKDATGRYVKFTITGTTGGVWGSVWEFDVRTKQPLPNIFDAILGTAPASYMVTNSPAVNGTIASDKATVESGGDVTFTVTPDAGYQVAQFTVNSVAQNLDAQGRYTAANVQENLVAGATFVPVGPTLFTITAGAGTGGTITPSGTISVQQGGSQRFTVAANDGYDIGVFTVNGAPLQPDSDGSYTLANVQQNLLVHITFTPRNPQPDQVTVTAIAGAGGTISPSGTLLLPKGADQSFTVTPTTGYRIGSVTADGVAMEQVNSHYPLGNIQVDVTVIASFELIPPIPGPAPSSGGKSSSRGGSSTQDQQKATSTAPQSSQLEQGAAQAGIQKAVKSGQKYLRTQHSGSYSVTAASLAAMGGAGLAYQHDTMDGTAVQVRLTIPQPGKITQDIQVASYTKGTQVDRLRSNFERWFHNQVRVVYVDNTIPWGQTVEFAAKVDLSGLDLQRLHLYGYRPSTNTYSQIKEPQCRIDQNGYLHFRTDFAGPILISDGPLSRR